MTVSIFHYITLMIEHYQQKRFMYNVQIKSIQPQGDERGDKGKLLNLRYVDSTTLSASKYIMWLIPVCRSSEWPSRWCWHQASVGPWPIRPSELPPWTPTRLSHLLGTKTRSTLLTLYHGFYDVWGKVTFLQCYTITGNFTLNNQNVTELQL